MARPAPSEPILISNPSMRVNYMPRNCSIPISPGFGSHKENNICNYPVDYSLPLSPCKPKTVLNKNSQITQSPFNVLPKVNNSNFPLPIKQEKAEPAENYSIKCIAEPEIPKSGDIINVIEQLLTQDIPHNATPVLYAMACELQKTNKNITQLQNELHKKDEKENNANNSNNTVVNESGNFSCHSLNEHSVDAQTVKETSPVIVYNSNCSSSSPNSDSGNKNIKTCTGVKGPPGERGYELK